MVKIPLTKNQIVMLSDEDADLLGNKWYVTKKGYVIGYFNKRSRLIHRIILERVLQWKLARGHEEEVDHINGNKLDNRRTRLRLATVSMNQANRGIPRNNKSGFKGICFHRRDARWNAQIAIRGRNIHLGCFSIPQEVARVYDVAALQYLGEFARLNFPEAKWATPSMSTP